MPIHFSPRYAITPKIAGCLIRIEAAKTKIVYLPMTPTVLASLRETARLYTTHYSTFIEGNRLGAEQVEVVLKHEGHFPGRERDELEVKGYYTALAQVEQWAAQGVPVTEKKIQTLHALVMRGNKGRIVPTPYRDGQNVIRDSTTRRIVYLPPEAKDVPDLMRGMVKWLQSISDLPCPLVASIIHYQFATIHPYFDGNGRTARLLTTWVLHLGGYDLKGLYSLEEYYARRLGDYYEAISIGDSHNYYLGRNEADITRWIEYFVEGMASAFEKVLKRMTEAGARGEVDHSDLIRALDPRQRRVLELFQEFNQITAKQVGELFGFKPRTSAHLCKNWVDQGFLQIADASNRKRQYALSSTYKFIGKQV